LIYFNKLKKNKKEHSKENFFFFHGLHFLLTESKKDTINYIIIINHKNYNLIKKLDSVGKKLDSIRIKEYL
jgi:hypothetical protein